MSPVKLLLTLLLLSLATLLCVAEEDNTLYLPAQARQSMVIAGEPRAAQIGRDILRRGGNAVDAATATAMALAVTLPRAGNLGGGGFMIIRSPEGEVYALDFRETAPAATRRDQFLTADGSVDTQLALTGGLAVATPGTVMGLSDALERFGTMSFSEAARPAFLLARDGITTTPWLHSGLTGEAKRLTRFRSTVDVFYPEGQPPEIGSLFSQPELAQTFQTLMTSGPRSFYTGDIAKKIVDSVRANGGVLSLKDLASYKTAWREPVVGDFRGYRVYSMPPPSSGGVHLIQMLNILESDVLEARSLNSASTVHLMAETMRRAYADRARWLGDPDHSEVPVSWLISKPYARELREQIETDKASPSADLPVLVPTESSDTTHLCVVDGAGWAVSLTTTLNYNYGSGLVAEGTGILLNDQIADFALKVGNAGPDEYAWGEANALGPGKRPLSSMSPTLVEKDGETVAVLGAPGGSKIINAVFQVLLNLLAYDLDPQTAVTMPRIHHQWKPDRILHEYGFSRDTLDHLEAMGHRVEQSKSIGHVLLITVDEDGVLRSGEDPRRPAEASGY
jgi:gamma-glutamyltranspeptidase/glutathione hydrolase